MLLIYLATLAQPAANPCAISFATFSRAPALDRTSETVCVRDDRSRHGQYLVHRTVRDRGGSAAVSWASTRDCPTARDRLQDMEDLALPTPNVPGVGRELETITMDGIVYRLETLGLYGGASANIVLISNVGTPLARWIDATFAALAPCWRDSPAP